MDAASPSPCHIALLGCGNMGGALLRGWLRSQTGSAYSVLAPKPPPEFSASPLVYLTSQFEDFIGQLSKCDLLVLAVKPQILPDICSALADRIPQTLPILSIAAGCSLSFFTSFFGDEARLIRAMPNLPASIGQGITALYAPKSLDPADKVLAEKVMNAVGKTIWLSSEDQMHIVTALSGSGPAYFFYLAEKMGEAAEKMGLPDELAVTLVQETLIGSAALLSSQPETSAGLYRQQVTSPGGTTEAAISYLHTHHFDQTIFHALQAAAQRSRELQEKSQNLTS